MGISALLAAQILDASATGRSVLTGVDASAIRTTLGLGTLATQSPTGTPSASTFLRGDYSWQTIDLSGYVPYTGATGAVNLGANGLTARLGTFTGATNSGTQILRVDGTGGGFTRINDNGTVSISSDVSSGTNPLTISYNNSLLWQFAFNGTFSGNTGTVLNIGAGLMHLTSSGSGASAKANINTFYDLVIAPGGIGGGSASSVVEVRNSTNSQRLNLYGTFTDASNYRRLFLSSTTAGAFTLGVEGAGTGASGNTLTVGPAIFKTNDNEIYGVVKNGTSGSDTSRLFIWADGRQQARFGYASGYDGLLLGNGSYGPMIWLGGTTSSFPAIKRNAAALNFRLADDSADCDITAANGTFSAGTDTVSNPILNLSQTWNNAATTFTGILANVTDTASNAASLLLDLQVGGTSRFSVRKDGRLFVGSSNGVIVSGGGSRLTLGVGGTSFFNIGSYVGVGSTGAYAWSQSSDPANDADLFLYRDISNTLAQRNGTTAQVHRVYNTFTDASNYERAKIAWESNVLRIGTEKAGTGSARALELQTDGVTRLTVGTTGSSTFANRVMIDNAPSGGALGSPLLLVGGPAYTTTNQFYTIGFGFTNSFSNRPPIEIGFDETSSSANTLGDFIVATRNVTTNTAATVRVRIKADGTFGIEDGNNIEVGTTTGTKIGTATNQKLGFFDKTPVVQPTAVADATDAASVITQLNALLSRMRDLGLIAT